MNLDVQRGGRISSERARLGFSQQKAADAIGVRREMWAKYEAGSEPGANALAKMAKINVDVLYILTGHPASAETVLSKEERALLNSYRLCAAAARKNLLQTAALLAAGLEAERAPKQRIKIKAGGHAAGHDLTIREKIE
ncbi:MAG: helix-turn-helix domain-containing protein [Azonexus sp.]|nr:helix-turn-helix domain-containing protein [Azonexus sp.]